MNIFHFSSNHLISVKNKFFELLNGLYTLSELNFIFNRIIEHFGYSIYNQNILFNQSELIVISDYIKDLMNKKPLAYVLGYTYFYHLKLYVDENVLIPRPETEELVELSINNIKKMPSLFCPLRLLDIGTGSGCISIAIKKNIENIIIDAIDISERALYIAKKNAILHQSEINFIQKDILTDELDNLYHIIISNPPYIPISKANEEADIVVKNYEPHIALFSKNSTEFYERIFLLCKKYLMSNGLIILELNQFYADEVLMLAKKNDIFSDCKILKDMSGHKRFLIAHKN